MGDLPGTHKTMEAGWRTLSNSLPALEETPGDMVFGTRSWALEAEGIFDI